MPPRVRPPAPPRTLGKMEQTRRSSLTVRDRASLYACFVIGAGSFLFGLLNAALLLHGLSAGTQVIVVTMPAAILLILGASFLAHGVLGWRWGGGTMPWTASQALVLAHLPFTFFVVPAGLALLAQRGVEAGIRAAGYERCEGEVRDRFRKGPRAPLPDVYAPVQRGGCARL